MIINKFISTFQKALLVLLNIFAYFTKPINIFKIFLNNSCNKLDGNHSKNYFI